MSEIFTNNIMPFQNFSMQQKTTISLQSMFAKAHSKNHFPSHPHHCASTAMPCSSGTPPHLVVLQVPALDLLVLAGGEEVRLPGADGQGANSADVPGESQLELSRGQVPQLQGTQVW